MATVKRKNRWNQYSDFDVLEMLKKEIKRIGIEDYPSKTRYNELYDSERAMSATMYLNRFNMTWKELMEFIGMEYNKTEMARKRGSLGKGVPRKKYETKWTKMSDDEMLDVFESELNRLAVRTKQEYADRREKGVAPSTNVLMERFGSWTGALKRLERRK